MSKICIYNSFLLNIPIQHPINKPPLLVAGCSSPQLIGRPSAGRPRSSAAPPRDRAPFGRKCCGRRVRSTPARDWPVRKPPCLSIGWFVSRRCSSALSGPFEKFNIYNYILRLIKKVFAVI